MKQVTCIDPKNFGLTRGREYTATPDENNENYYFITNDRGVQQRYYHSLFEDIELEPSTFEEIVESLSLRVNREHNNQLDVSYSIDGEDFVRTVSRFQFSGSSISCGVHQMTNLNGVANTIQQQIHELPNRGDLRAVVLKKVFDHTFQHAIPSTGLVLASTNINNNNYIGKIVEELNPRSNYYVDAFNPNSGNTIRTWTIVTEKRGNYSEEDIDRARNRAEALLTA